MSVVRWLVPVVAVAAAAVAADAAAAAVADLYAAAAVVLAAGPEHLEGCLVEIVAENFDVPSAVVEVAVKWVVVVEKAVEAAEKVVIAAVAAVPVDWLALGLELEPGWQLVVVVVAVLASVLQLAFAHVLVEPELEPEPGTG